MRYKKDETGLFNWFDQSGREFKLKKISLEGVLDISNEEFIPYDEIDEDDEDWEESLQYWLMNAEEGDVYTDNSAYKVICIKPFILDY